MQFVIIIAHDEIIPEAIGAAHLSRVTGRTNPFETTWIDEGIGWLRNYLSAVLADTAAGGRAVRAIFD
ncbi:hypothetical protein ABIC08_008385 [Bradyrhizobium sp. RT9b]|uniref:hypothetical protein n=1 Tax=Bradyrhizobium sp. RT9b TaxID=3156385 RepID=UPI00339A2983